MVLAPFYDLLNVSYVPSDISEEDKNGNGFRISLGLYYYRISMEQKPAVVALGNFSQEKKMRFIWPNVKRMSGERRQKSTLH